MFKTETLKNVNLKTRSSVERNCIILVMKLLALNSLLVVRMERGVRWLARGGSGGLRGGVRWICRSFNFCCRPHREQMQMHVLRPTVSWITAEFCRELDCKNMNLNSQSLVNVLNHSVCRSCGLMDKVSPGVADGLHRFSMIASCLHSVQKIFTQVPPLSVANGLQPLFLL